MEEFRPVRRKDREIPREEALRLLEAGEYGTLATVSAAGVPAIVPLSYVVLEEEIYFHSAIEGEKLDHMKENPRVSFCVVGRTQPVYDKNFTTRYESVVVHGEASPVLPEEEKKRALMALSQKYLPGHIDKAPAAIASARPATAVWKITPLHITGKAKR